MSQAISLHVGMNEVDPAHYGSKCVLAGCVNDAKAMQEIASKRGFRTRLMINQEATMDAVRGFLTDASRTLTDGDTLFITYAGHGSSVEDLNNDEQMGGSDETWCLYDRMIIDDELAELWAEFEAGVRIIIVSDSCHSETIARMAEALSHERQRGTVRGDVAGGRVPLIGDSAGATRITGYRLLPAAAQATVMSKHREFYRSIQEQTIPKSRAVINATVLTLSACKDDEVAGDGDVNGLYTSKLLSVWNKGGFKGNYREFQAAVAAAVGTVQHPQYLVIGAPNAAFERERPFTAKAGNAGETDGGKYPPQEQDAIGASLDAQLQALKDGQDVPVVPLWRLALTVPASYMGSLPNESVLTFLQNEGADALMKAVLSARRVRSSNGTPINCRVEQSSNDVEYESTISIGY